MALAIRFQDMVDRGEVQDYADLARLGYVTRARITQIMNPAQSRAGHSRAASDLVDSGCTSSRTRARSPARNKSCRLGAAAKTMERAARQAFNRALSSEGTTALERAMWADKRREKAPDTLRASVENAQPRRGRWEVLSTSLHAVRPRAQYHLQRGPHPAERQDGGDLICLQ